LRLEIWNLSWVMASLAATMGVLLPFVESFTRSLASRGWGIL